MAYTMMQKILALKHKQEKERELNALPVVEIPQVVVEKVIKPEVVVPEVKEPEVIVPEVKEPETTVPEVKEPEAESLKTVSKKKSKKEDSNG